MAHREPATVPTPHAVVEGWGVSAYCRHVVFYLFSDRSGLVDRFAAIREVGLEGNITYVHVFIERSPDEYCPMGHIGCRKDGVADWNRHFEFAMYGIVCFLF